ncbi:MAG: energy-coupling factor transporter transmembrane protein EcfT [Lachnospiraceae bacterium]|nr:energy-coupling factor transporter transmembrane protein EcfT [Lachnospiraceae bacterium]
MKKLKLNPIVLIVINILAPSLYIFINGMYLQPVIAVFCGAILLLLGYFRRFAIYLAVYGLLYGIYYACLCVDGLQFIAMFFLVFTQMFPCFMLASILISKYSSAELLSALEDMHLPRVLVVAATITLKYIPTFGREFRYIKESMRLRGIAFTIRRPVSSFRYFVAPQLFRCAALAEEVTAAGMVKGIDAPMRRSSYYEQRFRITDVLVLMVFTIGVAGAAIWSGR